MKSNVCKFHQNTDSAHFHYTGYAHFHYTGVGVQEDTRSRQVGGTHYVSKKVQPWDAMEAWMTKEQFVGFLLGSAIAYLGRFNAEAPGKGGIEDIKKAQHYLEKLIETFNK